MSTSLASPQPDAIEREIVASSGAHAASIDARWLLFGLTAYLALGQLLLALFLGFTDWRYWTGAIVLGVGLVVVTARMSTTMPRIPVARLLILLLFSTLLYALGGEGRFFYANIDWQVRDAVLRDMTINPWPFVYANDQGQTALLRAPIGFFLGPSLAAKLWGLRGGDVALLVQNSFILTLVLGLGSTLFSGRRQRIIALTTLAAFSGVDWLAQLAVKGKVEDHLEFTFDWLQYSSHITQAFWVPQHALAGWIGALLFLLWRRRSIPLWPVITVLPLTAIWSPLPLIGMIPFAVWAAVATVWRGELTVWDVIKSCLGLLLSVPALLYLAAAPDAVGARLAQQPMVPFALFYLTEVMIWTFPLLLWVRGSWTAPVLVSAIVLSMLPFANIGWSIDLMMRASIPALAIIAVAAAEALGRVDVHLRARLWLSFALLAGSITGLHELSRALTHPPSPRGECSFFGAWDVSFSNYPKGSHIAPLDRVPAAIRPAAPTIVAVNDPDQCWTGRWFRPSGV